MGNNKQRSHIFFIEDSIKIHPYNFLHNILVCIFISWHSYKLDVDAVLALPVAHQAIDINDKKLDLILESHDIRDIFPNMDDKKHLSRARFVNESFRSFTALNT